MHNLSSAYEISYYSTSQPLLGHCLGSGLEMYQSLPRQWLGNFLGISQAVCRKSHTMALLGHCLGNDQAVHRKSYTIALLGHYLGSTQEISQALPRHCLSRKRPRKCLLWSVIVLLFLCSAGCDIYVLRLIGSILLSTSHSSAYHMTTSVSSILYSEHCLLQKLLQMDMK